MKKALLVPLSIALAWSCASGNAPNASDTKATSPPAPPTAGTPDSEIGLAPGTAFEQPAQVPIAFNPADPGESGMLPRPNADFPPVIPDTIADLETIPLDGNAGLECHDLEFAPDMGAPEVPGSHLVDLRNSPETAGEHVVGSRWVCTSCHVARTETVPLVANPAVN